MRRALASFLVAASALAAASAADAARYRVVSATATAHLAFATPGGGNTFSRGTVTATFTRRGKPSARGDGSVTSRGGRVLFPLRGRSVEQVVLGERSDATSPYVETTCGDRRASGGRGGLVFRRLSRSRLEVRWAFPNAGVRLCPGPRSVAPARRMVTVLPTARLRAKRVRIVLAGTAGFRVFAGQQYTGTYRWRAVVTLARV